MTITSVFPGSEQAAQQLEHLATEIRQLWQSGPAVDGVAREMVLLELTQLDLTVELLRLRVAAGRLDGEDWPAIQEVAITLATMHEHWPAPEAVA